jgi:ribonuclease R
MSNQAVVERNSSSVKANQSKGKKGKVKNKTHELELSVLTYFLKQQKGTKLNLGQVIKALMVRRGSEQALNRALNFLCKDKVLVQDSNRQYRLHDNYKVNMRKYESKLEGVKSSKKARPVIDFSKFDKIVAIFDGEKNLYMPMHKQLNKIKITALKRDVEKHKLVDGNVVSIAVKSSKDGNTIDHADLLHVVAETLSGNEREVAMYTYNIPAEFPEAVMREVDKLEDGISEQEMARRVDLRHLPLVTIDGSDARDFDDAVYAEKLSNGNMRLIVAIADVSFYVKQGTALYEEAYNRSFSTYFPDMVVPMLPERLSNDLCSLVPNQDRPVAVAEMVINKHGSLESYKHYKAVIHSHARLTYEEVQQAMDGDFSGKVDEDFYLSVISPLEEAYNALRYDAAVRGAMALEINETRIFIKDGEITELSCRDRTDSHKLIECFMVVANIASSLAYESKVGVYRTHEEPKEEKIDALIGMLSAFGVSIPEEFMQEDVILHPSMFRKLAESIDHLANRNTLLNMLVRAMSKARYSTDNIGHFGLAIGCDTETTATGYVHFTSPIRRMPDLNAHEIIFDNTHQHDPSLLQDKCNHYTSREIAVENAANEVTQRVLVRSYEDRIDEVFDVIISNIMDRRIFITIPETGAEGSISTRQFNKLGYQFNPESSRFEVEGDESVTQIALGDKLKAKLSRVNVLSMSMNFDFVDFA